MHKIFTAWLHSLGGTFAGGHFHLTAGLAVLILAILVIVIPATRSGGELGRPSSGETGVFLAVMAALVGIAYYIAHAKPAHPAAVAVSGRRRLSSARPPSCSTSRTCPATRCCRAGKSSSSASRRWWSA